MKVLVDTNVVIDALTSREPWKDNAEKIFIMSANHIIDMYITTSSATDIYYLIRKHMHSSENARLIMEKLYSLTGILDVSGMVCMEALASPIKDYEDAVVERVARRAEVDYIVTRNLKDYQAGNTKVISPEDLIALIEDDN